jgi:hypothetical protein
MPLTVMTRGNRVRRGLAHRLAAIEQTGGTVVWVYAITVNLAPGQIDGLVGVGGEQVRAVSAGGLTAVVGSVDTGVFGEKALPSLLSDLASIERIGRLHHQIIAVVAAGGPVLPLRLATIYPDDDTVEAMLGQRGAELGILLESFRDTEEWGVKIYAEDGSPPLSGGPHGRKPVTGGDQEGLQTTGTVRAGETVLCEEALPQREAGRKRRRRAPAADEILAAGKAPAADKTHGPEESPDATPAADGSLAAGGGPGADGSLAAGGSPAAGGGPGADGSLAAGGGPVAAGSPAGGLVRGRHATPGAAEGTGPEVPGFPLTGWPVNGCPGKGGPAGGRASDAPSPWDDVESCAQVIDRALSSMSVASRRQPATVPAAAGEPSLLLSAVYLLSSDRVAEFTTVARALGGVRHGIRVDLTGPWPPYSFADVHGV